MATFMTLALKVVSISATLYLADKAPKKVSYTALIRDSNITTKIPSFSVQAQERNIIIRRAKYKEHGHSSTNILFVDDQRT